MLVRLAARLIGLVVVGLDQHVELAAIKQLAPIQRSYNAQTREWPVDLLALPELLCYLAPLGYTPSPPLKATRTLRSTKSFTP